jgi:putative membrane protein
MTSLRFTDKPPKPRWRRIRAIESATSAEVVVAVRARSGHYRHTDYLVGFILSFAALLVFLFATHEFSLDWMPVDTLVAFTLGTLLSAGFSPLRRALTSRKLMRSNVRSAARAAFVDLGVARTSARSGLLVFVSSFERRVEVVADIGIDKADARPSVRRRCARADVDSPPSRLSLFLEALRSLGPILSRALPRTVDDANELPDEPST